jgi:phosphoribosyl-dephospho-CoA transferase
LVWIHPECREAVAAQVTDDAMQTQVAAWLAADRPLVVARQPVADVGAGHAREQNDNRGHGPLLQKNFHLLENGIANTIAVGLALPPAHGKRRIALSVATHDIARYTLPLRLADAIAHAPAAWQPALVGLDAAAKIIDIELRVFGSLAWQALSGIQYLTPQSDIDLLWQPLSHAQLQQGIALLARWEQDSGLRADGEVLFGVNSAVSWREWAMLKSGDGQRVLVKRERSAGLVAARELLELLA